MYQNVFEKGGKLEVFSPKDLLRENLGGDKAKMKLVSSGEYEGGLLCKDCDNNVIGKYESYASKTIYAKKDIPPALAPICENGGDENLTWSHCRNVDYKKFKLFLLSILWKSSISGRPLFSEVCLGKDEDVIREMLLNGDPKSVFDYPIMVIIFVSNRDAPALVAQPIRNKISDGLTVYRYVIDKMILDFCVATDPVDIEDRYVDFTIKPNNTMKVLCMPPGTANEFLLRHSGIL